MAIGDLGATDIFSLGAGFNAQSSSTNNARDIVEVLGASGDIACLTPFNTVVTTSAEYEVCGSQTLSISLGDVVGGYIVNSVELSHSAGSAPTVSIEGIAFDGGETVNSNAYAISQAVNIASVSGLMGVASTEATEISYRWECEVTQSMGSDGQVSYAVSRTPKLTYTESGIGTLSSAPSITDYTLESYENSDSNQETDTYTATFVKELVSA
jgi:hypothetical protein